ncbi:acetyl-CoA carboxylase biotin carboxyl carrier protein [Paracoccus alkenifer]|uniref:Biotin carboxyl carrier protein of acetyl-CoA carboxylase n=1 Tax=Paracoccus alkenifer TaxID=65735 RepID=A0A1H6JH44_9RHOB|nr:acetyl-CoA carboxylase biotin carboxyl carrier protein [Paracoccus alkenifer]SEH61598.1 acetyl-CoA carboxylase biotin carboxyl carrier protein [Paracoccus alkenifer]
MSDKDPTRHHADDTAFIQALAELLNRNDLTELKVEREYGEDDRLTVELSKHGRQVAIQAPAYAPPAAQPAPGPAPAAPAPAAAAASDPASHPGAVPSPMVGTAYLSPEPGAAAFVSIGQQVAEGDTLMIVEAMKTMNHIPAPRAGTVRRVLVEDGTPVEFGTTLMIVE